jgi:hypothetical protein
MQYPLPSRLWGTRPITVGYGIPPYQSPHPVGESRPLTAGEDSPGHTNRDHLVPKTIFNLLIAASLKASTYCPETHLKRKHYLREFTWCADAYPHTIPVTRPTPCAPLAIEPMAPNRQRKNQAVIMMIV